VLKTFFFFYTAVQVGPVFIGYVGRAQRLLASRSHPRQPRIRGKITVAAQDAKGEFPHTTFRRC
jgi:hypothetical protein